MKHNINILPKCGLQFQSPACGYQGETASYCDNTYNHCRSIGNEHNFTIYKEPKIEKYRKLNWFKLKRLQFQKKQMAGTTIFTRKNLLAVLLTLASVLTFILTVWMVYTIQDNKVEIEKLKRVQKWNTQTLKD